MDDRSLKHFGVLGMKWGVRKDRNKGRTTPSTKTGSDAKRKARQARAIQEARTEKRKVIAEAKAQKKEARSPKKISISEMSTTELKTQIDRLKLEREFQQFMEQQNPPSNMVKAKKLVGAILLDVGTKQAKNLLNRKISTMINESMKKKKED